MTMISDGGLCWTVVLFNMLSSDRSDWSSAGLRLAPSHVQSAPEADNQQHFDVVYPFIFKEYWLERAAVSAVRHSSDSLRVRRLCKTLNTFSKGTKCPTPNS